MISYIENFGRWTQTNLMLLEEKVLFALSRFLLKLSSIKETTMNYCKKTMRKEAQTVANEI